MPAFQSLLTVTLCSILNMFQISIWLTQPSEGATYTINYLPPGGELHYCGYFMAHYHNESFVSTMESCGECLAMSDIRLIPVISYWGWLKRFFLVVKKWAIAVQLMGRLTCWLPWWGDFPIATVQWKLSHISTNFQDNIQNTHWPSMSVIDIFYE